MKPPAVRWLIAVTLLIFGLSPQLSLAASTKKHAPSRPHSRRIQESQEEQKLREKQQKEDERKEKEAKNKAKQLKKELSFREFAEDLYATDPEFREGIDKEYLDLQQQHAILAFEINTGEKVSPRKGGDEEVLANRDALGINRTLYDHPLIQEYINRVGQRLVPDDSDKLYTFKIVSSPIPYAFSLSTGTVLISTGMVGMLDNEAQLAYVLAHEIAHIHKDHWRYHVMFPLAAAEYEESREKKRKTWSLIGAAAGLVIGGAVGKGKGAVTGLGLGFAAGYAVSLIKNRSLGVDWEKTHEDEADDFALRTVIRKQYDAQEVPRLLAELRRVSSGDSRMQLGFLGERNRLRERIDYSERMLQTDLRPTYLELVKSGKMIGTTPEYNLTIAELKRDNGIAAFQYDMLTVARKNLEQAVSLRSDDAVASYYYGRVLKQVARTPEEQLQAQDYLAKAIKLDTRNLLPETKLYRAIILMNKTDAASQNDARQFLKDYISGYQKKMVDNRRTDATLPPNVALLYDYLRLLGDTTWVAPPPDLIRLTTASGIQAVPPNAGEVQAGKGNEPQATPATPVKSGNSSKRNE